MRSTLATVVREYGLSLDELTAALQAEPTVESAAIDGVEVDAFDDGSRAPVASAMDELGLSLEEIRAAARAAAATKGR